MLVAYIPGSSVDMGTYADMAEAESRLDDVSRYEFREISEDDLRLCSICGHDHITSTNPETDFCRSCYHSGRSEERRFADLLGKLTQLESVEGDVRIWNSGGGCFILTIDLKDGRCLWATSAFQDPASEQWQVDSGMPDDVGGPWGISVADSPEAMEEAEGDQQVIIPVMTADFPAVVAGL